MNGLPSGLTTLRALLCGAILLVGSSPAAGQLIPTPEFSDHPIPTSSLSSPGSVGWEYLDVLVLLVALSLATYFALVTRSRRHLFVLTIASLVWFGFWRQGCVCPIGATQNVALAAGDASYAVPFSVVAFFVLPLVFTLFFGRTFCAAVCPLGAVQELVAVRPLAVPRWLDASLGLLAYVYLGAAVILAYTGTAFIVCRYDPFVAFFRLSGHVHILLWGGLLLVVGLFVGRPYCRYLCPYGAILRILSRLAAWHVRIPPTNCIQCRLCEDSCPYGAIQQPTVTISGSERATGRRRLVVLLLAAPLLVATFSCLGIGLAVPLSRWDRDVELAEFVRRDELGLDQPAPGEEVRDDVQAFRSSGRPPSELYSEAVDRQREFRFWGGVLGAWIGVVLSTKAVALAVRRRREEFTPDRSGCVSCGRCFWYCPVEQVRLGLIEDVSQVVEEH